MKTGSIAAHGAVLFFFAAASISCAAEHLEGRHPKHGVTDPTVATTTVVRPTELRGTEKQLGSDAAAPSDLTPMPAHEPAAHEPHQSAAVYRCPMHPEVQSPSPGTCPKCGMTLQKETSP